MAEKHNDLELQDVYENYEDENNRVKTTLFEDIREIKSALQEIQSRNHEKENDKAFETSYTRMLFIMIITYFTLFGYMKLIGVSSPFLNAVIPSIGFNLSTWSLPFVKWVWVYFTGRREAKSLL